MHVREMGNGGGFGVRRILILSDSKSGLQKIARVGIDSASDFCTLKTKEKMYSLREHGRRIEFLWIPGHSNIRWNEKAGELARSVRADNLVIGDKYRLHYTNFLRASIKDRIWTSWISSYRSIGIHKGKAYWRIQNVPPKVPWFSKISSKMRKFVSVHGL